MSYKKQNITQLDIVNLVEILNHIEDGMVDIENSTEADKSEFSEYIASELAKRGQLKPEFAESLEWLDANGDQSKMYVLPDGYIYASIYSEVEVGGYTNVIDTDKDDFLTKQRLQASTSKVLTSTEANAFVSNIFELKEGDILRIKGVGRSETDSATAPIFVVAPFNSDGTAIANHEFALAQPAYTGSSLFTSWKQAWNAIETAEDGTITWTYAINNTGANVANLNLSTSVTHARIAGVALNGFDNIIVTVDQPIVEPTIERKYAWTNTGRAFIPADYEDRIVDLENDVSALNDKIPELEKSVSTLEGDVSTIKKAVSFGALLNYDIFDYAYIKGGELVVNALNLSSNKQGHYTGVKMDGRIKRIMCKAKLSTNSTVVLISTNLGSSIIANITRGSIHLIFNTNGCSVGIYDGGTSPLRNVIQYACPVKEGTEVSFGYAVDETTNTLTVYLPDGTTKTLTDAALSVVNGEYAIWEHYGNSLIDEFKCCHITKLWCEDIDGNILDDDLKRLDGAIGVAPTGQTYRQFRTGQQTDRDFA